MSELTRRDLLKKMATAAAGAGLTLWQGAGEAQRRFDGETLRVQFWAGGEG
jgi:hypothetical protein